MALKNKNNNLTGFSAASAAAGKILFCTGLFLMTACSSLNILSGGSAEEQAAAENRIMKKNLTHALRENSVLKDENLQYKDENSRQKTRIKLLESEMESLNKKYEQDIALLNDKYENLNKKNIILQQESSSKIQELNMFNKALEEKMIVEVTKLNENIRKQEEAFNRERAAIETAFSSKELEYQRQLALLKKEILNASMELESFKSKSAESESKLIEAKSEMAKRDDTIRELKLKIDSLAAEKEVKVDKEVKKEESPEIKTGN